jgi:hypothetical protein
MDGIKIRTDLAGIILALGFRCIENRVWTGEAGRKIHGKKI